jgi:hypothetical protein
MTAAAAATMCLVALVRHLESREALSEVVERASARAASAEPEAAPSCERITASATMDETAGAPEGSAVSPEETAEVLTTPESKVATRAVPAGTLELLVLEGERPLADAQVFAVGRIEGGLSSGSIDEGARLLQALSGSDGRVAWSELRADHYDTIVRHPDGAELACTLEVPEGFGTETRVVRFGDACLRGVVLDELGEPRADSEVRLALAPCEDGTPLVLTTRTDGAGQFRFQRLPAGSALASDAHPDVSWLSPGRSVRVELQHGTTREIQLGATAVGSLWRGRLLGPGGAPFPNSLALRWREPQQGWNAQARTGLDGAFELHLRPGSWSAFVPGREGPIEIAQATVDRDVVTQDLALPSGCVTVQLVDGEGAPIDGAIALVDAQGHRTEHPAPGGTAFVAALTPGVWQVEGLGFSEAPTQARLTVADHGAPVELVLELREP